MLRGGEWCVRRNRVTEVGEERAQLKFNVVWVSRVGKQTQVRIRK